MKTIQNMYDHLNWANQRMLKTLQSIEDGNQEVNRLFSHILFGERIWITRLQALDSSQLPVWSDIDLEICAELVMLNEVSFTEYLTDLVDSDLDKLIFYTNSKGTEFKHSARDILTHVALHGQYHRGQINSKLRATGLEPVNIDFIKFLD
ncbi:DinB family protein [Psychrobacillus sp. OK032]|uniref:DinB family protein n=1 Tax=Psychrobacillus sp. OK032 TaxID=1884358 RepID=UPI0008B2FC44|nr:DinB family protein [Psychrobacillus sp. OK032]SES13479.1 Uncharacterized damage-inducible protein DinB (forms a four-helix bundle) [Psychrobacillus sp. OK032]